MDSTGCRCRSSGSSMELFLLPAVPGIGSAAFCAHTGVLR